jgi:hypothetical protein
MGHKLIATAPVTALMLAACADAPTSPARPLPPETPSFAAAALTISQDFPIDLFAFVPCAAGGAGELVELTGQLHDLFHITQNNAGGVVVRILDNPQGVSGVGLTTGTKYQGTGGTQQTFTAAVGETNTFVNNFRVVGQGPNNNFVVHETAHLTVNANGTVTASVDNLTIDCK